MQGLPLFMCSLLKKGLNCIRCVIVSLIKIDISRFLQKINSAIHVTTCKTCNEFKNSCTSCNKTANRKLIYEECVCINGFSDHGKDNETSQACDVSCATCFNS